MKSFLHKSRPPMHGGKWVRCGDSGDSGWNLHYLLPFVHSFPGFSVSHIPVLENKARRKAACLWVYGKLCNFPPASTATAGENTTFILSFSSLFTAGFCLYMLEMVFQTAAFFSAVKKTPVLAGFLSTMKAHQPAFHVRPPDGVKGQERDGFRNAYTGSPAGENCG